MLLKKKIEEIKEAQRAKEREAEAQRSSSSPSSVTLGNYETLKLLFYTRGKSYCCYVTKDTHEQQIEPKSIKNPYLHDNFWRTANAYKLPFDSVYIEV
ncbi:hypothetical protein AGMMS50222_11110 [Endomicrobiia bacterium]|nr:hypothetical protein AGMMS49556_09350 [Endomicrobiia bacterium]GHT77685.1 hypothetical protein AGMMS50222_11110 [Endomicrobiia bacterium]